MSKIENSKLYDISFASHEASLEGLGKELSKVLLSDKDLASAALRLEKLRTAIRSPESKDHLAVCYGRIHTLKTNNLVDRIVDHTFSLAAHKDGMSRKEVEKKAEAIEGEVARLWHEHALSVPNRRFIKMAMSQLNALRNLPSRQMAHAQNREANDASAILVIEKELACSKPYHCASSVQEESADVAFELCDIARSFYRRYIHEGMKKLRQLTFTQKSRLYEIVAQFKQERSNASSKTVIIENSPQSHCSFDMMHLIQALVSYAHEIAQGEPVTFYPSESEIHMMFREVEHFYEK